MKKILSEIKYDAEFIRGHTLQPQWYKILKVFLLLGILGGYFALFGGWKTLVFCGIFFGLSTVLHLVYRIKTRKFTQTWLDFVVHEDDQGQRTYQRIGAYYYLAVSFFLITAIIFSQILV
jgi:hypothetical protein